MVSPIATPSFCFGARGKRIAAGGLAGFGAAKLEHAPSRRLFAEVVVEGDGAVDLGAGKVKRLGHQRHGLVRHAAERLLQGMQDRKGGALQMPIPRDDFARALGVPWLVSWHAQPL